MAFHRLPQQEEFVNGLLTGMTCANCAVTIERSLKKLPGVESCTVNLASERAAVEFDPDRLTRDGIIGRIRDVGYGVAVARARLPVAHLADDNDARMLERALTREEGVLSAQVNPAAERAFVEYIPTLVTQAALCRAAESAGFRMLEAEEGDAGSEFDARAREIAEQRRKLWIALAFTVPIFSLSMGEDLHLLPTRLASWTHLDWLLLALATPVQFYVGWQFYRGTFKALRNGAANMDVLIAMGSSAAYLLSLVIVIGRAAGSPTLIHAHTHFDSAANAPIHFLTW